MKKIALILFLMTLMQGNVLFAMEAEEGVASRYWAVSREELSRMRAQEATYVRSRFARTAEDLPAVDEEGRDAASTGRPARAHSGIKGPRSRRSTVVRLRLEAQEPSPSGRLQVAADSEHGSTGDSFASSSRSYRLARPASPFDFNGANEILASAFPAKKKKKKRVFSCCGGASDVASADSYFYYLSEISAFLTECPFFWAKCPGAKEAIQQALDQHPWHVFLLSQVYFWMIADHQNGEVPYTQDAAFDLLCNDLLRESAGGNILRMGLKRDVITGAIYLKSREIHLGPNPHLIIREMQQQCRKAERG